MSNDPTVQFSGYIDSVVNVSALRNYDTGNLATGATIIVDGHDYIGDANGGIYVLDTASTATDDGLHVVTPASGGGRWLLAAGAGNDAAEVLYKAGIIPAPTVEAFNAYLTAEGTAAYAAATAASAEAQSAATAADQSASDSAASAVISGQHATSAANSAISANANADRAAAASSVAGVYLPAYSISLPRGVVALTGGVGTGTAGVAGTYQGGVSGGPTGFAWTYTIGADGKIASYAITDPGLSTATTAPTLSYPSGGIAGATVPVASVAGLVGVGETYWTIGNDNASILLWTNDGTTTPAAVQNGNASQVSLYEKSAIDAVLATIPNLNLINSALVGSTTTTLGFTDISGTGTSVSNTLVVIGTVSSAATVTSITADIATAGAANIQVVRNGVVEQSVAVNFAATGVVILPSSAFGTIDLLSGDALCLYFPPAGSGNAIGHKSAAPGAASLYVTASSAPAVGASVSFLTYADVRWRVSAQIDVAAVIVKRDNINGTDAANLEILEDSIGAVSALSAIYGETVSGPFGWTNTSTTGATNVANSLIVVDTVTNPGALDSITAVLNVGGLAYVQIVRGGVVAVSTPVTFAGSGVQTLTSADFGTISLLTGDIVCVEFPLAGSGIATGLKVTANGRAARYMNAPTVPDVGQSITFVTRADTAWLIAYTTQVHSIVVDTPNLSAGVQAALSRTVQQTITRDPDQAIYALLAQLCHIVLYGQSLSLGVAAGSALSTSANLPWAKMFHGGLRSRDAQSSSSNYQPDFYSSFTALKETFVSTDDGYGESGAYGMMEMIAQLLLNENVFDISTLGQQFLVSEPGEGSQPISTLMSPSGTYWPRVEADITNGASLSSSGGLAYLVQALIWRQGERDTAIGTDPTTYKNELKTNILAALHDYAQSVTGVDQAIPCIVYQFASFRSYGKGPDIPLALLDLAENESNFALSTPLYIFPTSVGAHKTATGYRRMGGYEGIALKRWLIDGVKPQHLQALDPIWLPNRIIIPFAVPSGRLVLDTTLVSDPGNYGFALQDASGNAITITGVSLLGTDRVVIDYLGSALTSGAELHYAFGTSSMTSDGSPTAGPRGCLRDSQGDNITFHGDRMDNWAPVFRKVK